MLVRMPMKANHDMVQPRRLLEHMDHNACAGGQLQQHCFAAQKEIVRLCKKKRKIHDACRLLLHLCMPSDRPTSSLLALFLLY